MISVVIITYAVLVCADVTASVTNETCNSLPAPTFLKKGRQPITALASFQGSGNTWVRQVLASATGYKTGDLYKSYGDDLYPEFSSLQDDSVLAIKTHTYSEDNTEEVGFKRAVLIVRNPLDALYSEFNRMFGGNKTGYAHARHLINDDGSLSWKWDTWMTHITSWVDFYTYYLKLFKGQVHVIYYNNLKSDLHEELLQAVKFLGLKPDAIRLNCTIEHPKPPYFKRPAKPPPVAKTKLFSLSLSKAKQAKNIIRNLVRDRFGEDSDNYKRFNLQIGVKELR